MESTTSVSSRKRSALEDPTVSSPVMHSTHLCDTIPPALSDPTPNDIDAYMDSQGKSDVLQPTLFPPSHQSNPFLSPLLDSDGNLNEDLVEGVDFECIPDVAWDWLTTLYVFVNHQAFHVVLTLQVQISHL